MEESFGFISYGNLNHYIMHIVNVSYLKEIEPLFMKDMQFGPEIIAQGESLKVNIYPTSQK